MVIVEDIKPKEKLVRRFLVPFGIVIGVVCLACGLISGFGVWGFNKEPNVSAAWLDFSAVIAIWGMVSGRQWTRPDFLGEVIALLIGAAGSLMNLAGNDVAVWGNFLVAIAVAGLGFLALSGKPVV